jgi:hypothetical protein
MKLFFRNSIVYICIALVVLALAWYCSSHIDKSRKEKADRESRLEAGTCEFDVADLNSVTIEDNGIKMSPVEKLENLLRIYPMPFRGVIAVDSLSSIQKTRISNTEFEFYSRGNTVYISTINLDLSSEFQLNVYPEILNSRSDLDDIKKAYPLSYDCRKTFLVTNRTENVVVRIENNSGGSLSFVLLYFNYAEQLYRIRFFHEGVNI